MLWMNRKSNIIDGGWRIKRSSLAITAGRIVNRDLCAHSGYKLIFKTTSPENLFFIVPSEGFMIAVAGDMKIGSQALSSSSVLWMDRSLGRTNLNIIWFLEVIFLVCGFLSSHRLVRSSFVLFGAFHDFISSRGPGDFNFDVLFIIQILISRRPECKYVRRVKFVIIIKLNDRRSSPAIARDFFSGRRFSSFMNSSHVRIIHWLIISMGSSWRVCEEVI